MNHIHKGWLLFSMSLVMLSCTTPEMLVDKSLQEESMVYEVSGRNGWLVNQTLSFGEYFTGKVNRSWTKGYDYPFIVRFTGAKEKLSYSIQDGQANAAEVFCLAKLREQDLRLFHEYFDVNLNTKDAFSGSVIVNKTEAYDFFLANLNQNNWFKDAGGYIQGVNERVEIRAVERLSNNQKSTGTQALGFEFVLKGKVIGAVETLNRGRIWMRQDLEASQKLVLAGVASALLLRSDLSEHNDQNS